MAKQKKVKFGIKLLIAMLVYAVIFLAGVAFGLSWFWDYIAAYEASRPQTAIDAYMDQLEVSHIQDKSANLIATIDHNLQSEKSCLDAIANALTKKITYARKVSECTDTKKVYMLLCDKKTIGSFTLTAGDKDEFGFTLWSVIEETFDFSFLIGEGTSVTVPFDYPVYVNGFCLNEDYVTETNIHYPKYEEYYDDCAFPYMVTYKAPAIMGTLEVTIKDRQGNPISEEDALNVDAVLNNCTEEEITALDTIAAKFLKSYVAFTTNAGKKITQNYNDLLNYLVPNGSLAERMDNARSGLKWVPDRGASIVSSEINGHIAMQDGRYLYDISYIVICKDSTVIQESVRIIFAQTEDGLRAETMTSY